MRNVKNLLFGAVTLVMLLGSSCKSANNTQKGAAIGTGGGAALGAGIGALIGGGKGAAWGAGIGAVVGGATGAVIGKKMDKQAEAIKQQVPDAKVERVDEGITVEFSSDILFQINKFDLSAEAKSNLDKLVTILNSYADTDIEIQGYTDNTGTDAYNQTLSEKRAGSVSSYLQSKGIAASRITTKGFGKQNPKYSNDTKDGQAKNRRVEFVISANEKMKEDAAKEAGQPVPQQK